MDEERDRYLSEFYGEPEIVTAKEGEPEQRLPGMPVYLKIEFEEAREAEAWFGIEHDLGFVVRAATRAAEIAEREDEGREGYDIEQHSLWTTALIAYARCFGSGVRGRRLDQAIFGDREDVIQQHRYFKNIRDKHLAHSVNPFEVAATGIAVLDPDSEEPHVFHAISMYATRSTEHTSTMRYLAKLAGWLQDRARERRVEALQKVLQRAKELTPGQLRQLSPLEVKPAQGYDVAGLPRPPKPST